MENKIPLIESFASKTFNRLPFEKRERVLGETFNCFLFLKKREGAW